MSLSGAGWPAALPALTTFARPGVLDNVSAGFAKRQRDVGAGIRRDSQSLQTSVGAGHLPLCTGPVHGRVECNEPHDARASSLTALPRDACLSALPSCAPGQCSCGLSCPRSNCGPGAQHLNRRAAAPQLVAFPELTERRNPQLATAQHQDDQDDKHDENDGSYADVHELSLSYQSLRPRRRPRAGYPAQSGLTREPTRARWRPRFSGSSNRGSADGLVSKLGLGRPGRRFRRPGERPGGALAGAERSAAPAARGTGDNRRAGRGGDPRLALQDQPDGTRLGRVQGA